MKATLSFWSSLWLLMLFPAQAAQITLSSITHTNTVKGTDLLLLDSYLSPGSYTTRVITLADFLATGGGSGAGVFTADGGIITPSVLSNATLYLGSGVSNWWGHSTDDGVVIVHDSSAGDSIYDNWAIVATDSASNSTNYSFFGMSMSTGPQPFATITVAALTNAQDLLAPSSHWNLYLQPDQNVARIQMVNQGTNTFDLGDTGALAIRDYLSLSGYTNQIADNGSSLTYNGVAVGGGDTIWTNSDGTITTTPTNSNVLSFTSQLADNATNVAMVVDTAVPWTADDEEKLFALRNTGTNVAYITQYGAIEIGRSVVPFWFPDKSDALAAVHDISLGESDAMHVTGSVIDSLSDTYDASFDINIKASASAPTTKLVMNAYDGAKFRGFWLDPTAAQNAAPFKFDTFYARTGSATVQDLAQFKNDGTNKVTVVYDGSITSGGNTNRLNWANAATGLSVTANLTNAIIATIDGRKVYLLIANETPP